MSIEKQKNACIYGRKRVDTEDRNVSCHESLAIADFRIGGKLVSDRHKGKMTTTEQIKHLL